jgi:toluene monooxygenase electron transfer component
MKIQVRARNKAYEYSVESGERLLYGGLRSGIQLPYECATGTCGTCRARLIEGEVEDLWPDSPGKKHLKPGSGELLLCQCAARGNLAVEVGGNVDRSHPGAFLPARVQGRITALERLTPDVVSFGVELPRAMPFEAGQFFVVGVPGIDGYRGYSMVNFSRSPERLEFVVKRLPGGRLSDWLFETAHEGAGVELFGPLGGATFHPSLDKDLLCIAGGSGIAGIMSILARADQNDYFDDHSGFVFFGVRRLADLFYADRLAAHRIRNPDNLEVVIALSDAPDEVEEGARRYPELAFDTGFVHEVAGRHMQGRYSDMVAFLAGPPIAVDASIRLLLLEARLPANCIRYDKFS